MNVAFEKVTRRKAVSLRRLAPMRIMMSVGDERVESLAAVDKEKAVERTVLEIRDKFGKNAVLRGINLNKAGTQRERNGFIGGHRAGYDDERAARETVHAL